MCGDRDVSVKVGATDRNTKLRKPVKQHRGRMPVVVVGPNGDQRDSRMDGSEEFRRRIGTAVVRDLEHLGR